MLIKSTGPAERAREMRVRIALHTRVADELDGDYSGPSVDRGARLLSAGTNSLERDASGFSRELGR